MFFVKDDFMKKLLSFLLIICCLASTFVLRNESGDIFSFDGCEQVCLISEKDFGFDSQRSGDKVFNFCSYEKAKEIYNDIKADLDGIQFYFKVFDEGNFYKKFRTSAISKSQVEGIDMVYGFSPCFENSILIDGKKQNFQVAKTKEWTILGFPIILTGY